MMAIIFIITILFVISSVATEYKPWTFLLNIENFRKFLFEDLFPPKVPEASMILKGILQTISMALVATLFATIVSFFLALLGSKATCSWKPFRKIIRFIASVERNIPNMIWIFILIMSFGIGNVVGMLALLIQSTGFLTRAFIETIDEIGEESIEALSAVGAGRLTIAIQAIIPACIADVASWVLYALEINSTFPADISK